MTLSPTMKLISSSSSNSSCALHFHPVALSASIGAQSKSAILDAIEWTAYRFKSTPSLALIPHVYSTHREKHDTRTFNSHPVESCFPPQARLAQLSTSSHPSPHTIIEVDSSAGSVNVKRQISPTRRQPAPFLGQTLVTNRYT